MILYVPFFRTLFQITPLNWAEWMAVLWISAPVVLIDEVLKVLSVQLGFAPEAKQKRVEGGAKVNGVEEKKKQ